jgi:hypothetical protein
LLSFIPAGARLALALLLCFEFQALSAQPAPRKLIVQRSTRAIPHRFIVHPSEVTVAINQMQHFEVTDAQGNPVAVHWNVSGLGCSGPDCGTIDEQGNYHTPPSLPKPRVVTLEGVLVSDPNYSVLTEVVLKDVVAAAPARASVRNAQELAAPEIAQQNLVASARMPLPNAVAAAPVIGRQNLASNAESVPLPNVVAAAPSVANRNLSRSAALPSTGVIPAPPAIGTQKLAHSSDLPTPNVIAAAPAVAAQDLARAAALPPPNVIAAPPAVGKQNLSRSPDLPAPAVIAAPPSVGNRILARNAELPSPSVIAAPPTVEEKNFVRSAALPAPNVIHPAPAVQKQDLARSAELPTTIVIAAAPSVGRQNLARNGNAELPPPSVIAAPPAIAKPNVARAAELPAPSVVAAPPAVEKQRPARGVELPTTIVIAATPGVADQHLARAATLPSPNVVAAAPALSQQNLAHATELPQPTVVAALTAVPPQFPAPQTPRFTPPAGQRQSRPGSDLLLPMPDVVVGVPAASAASAPPGTVVTYRDGLLTIDAENISLAALLQLIAEKTGAVIDVPKGTAQEHIFEHAGPDTANAVLQRLLNGSPFNFIIVSSPLNPNQPAQVLLSLHTPDTDAPVVASAPPPALTSPVLWKPPESAPTAEALPYAMDPKNMAPPKEQLSPEALGELMKQKAQEIREQLQKQHQ